MATKLKEIDLATLGTCLDSTWGRSSTPMTPTMSVKFTIMGGNRVVASYAAIVNFCTERQMIETKMRYEGESRAVIDACVANVAKCYKEASGTSLKFKEVATETSVEVINMMVHNAKRTAYMRRKSVFELS